MCIFNIMYVYVSSVYVYMLMQRNNKDGLGSMYRYLHNEIKQIDTSVRVYGGKQ